MTDESVFRSIVMVSIAITLPIGLYHRIRSQATREKLARREEGLFILVGLRLCGFLCWAGGMRIRLSFCSEPMSLALLGIAFPD